MAAAIPQVTVPMANDQPDNSARFLPLGASALIWPKNFNRQTGVAAVLCGRRFAGNDIAADAVELARSRIPGAGVVPDAPPFVPAGQRTLFGGGR